MCHTRIAKVIADTERRFWGCACLRNFIEARWMCAKKGVKWARGAGVMLPITLAFFGFYSLSSILHEDFAVHIRMRLLGNQ